jgi:oxaloacetate decarboxylase (Na+ extruding) subunit gamma
VFNTLNNDASGVLHHFFKCFYKLSTMLLAGLKLMFIGMTTVVLFLVLMILLIKIVSRLTVNIVKREVDIIKKAAAARAERAKKIDMDDDIPIAVLTAAVAAYENDVYG